MVDPATDSDGPLAFLTKQASDDARGVSALLPLLTDKAGGFVAQITDMTLCPSLDLVLGFLQLSPSVRMLFASGLLLGILPSCLDRCLLRDQMPRPFTIRVSPVLVETVAR